MSFTNAFWSFQFFQINGRLIENRLKAIVMAQAVFKRKPDNFVNQKNTQKIKRKGNKRQILAWSYGPQ